MSPIFIRIEKNEVTPFVERFRNRLRFGGTDITKVAALDIKHMLIGILDQKFGSGNRLSHGVTMDRTAEGYSIGIKAEGKPGTTNVANFIKVLNYGEASHSITPRNPKGVLAMVKPNEGVVFRKYVSSHQIRPRYFIEETVEKFQRMAPNTTRKAVRTFIDKISGA